MKQYITIQNILIFVIFVFVVNGFWQSNRKNYYKRELFNNFYERDSFAAVVRIQYYELEYLEDYVSQTDYYRELADSLWNEVLSLESTFETQHKIIYRNQDNFNQVYDKYKEAKSKVGQTDTVTIVKKEIVYKEAQPKKEKKGFFKRLFGKKKRIKY